MATWQEINQKRKPFIRMGERLFKGMYNEIRRSFIREIRQVDSPQEVDRVLEEFTFDVQMKESFTKFYVKTVRAFAKDTVNRYKGASKRLEVKSEEDWLAKILEYVDVEVGDFISETIYTHREDIIRITKKAVTEGVDQGWGMDQIARVINKDQAELNNWKALRIARTETVRASSYGTELGASELPGNKAKVWISSFTPTSRDDHMAADGQQVELGGWFRIGADELRYPGDPAAPPEQTINCRCAYEVIITDEIF